MLYQLMNKDVVVALKDFRYPDPGYDYPAWKLEAVNRLKDRMIDTILS